MNSPQYSLLEGTQRRVLTHFYREHGSRMRPAAEGVQWVARADALVGALNLSAVAEGHWLTGLFTAPDWRGRGIAGELLEAALAHSCGPTWLFCHPDLQGFYQRRGFACTEALPGELASRLARYRRGKALVAMVRGQSSLLGSKPGNSTSV
ncbi:MULTISPECIES: GNAT family N-acetyltransferase [unclassified Pseudomonas]|uniref:GNAT family N-acetyltransferase n=1 Tax=unclassified Pseudomonas TaxID=196821 RepID=UPI0035C012D0